MNKMFWNLCILESMTLANSDGLAYTKNYQREQYYSSLVFKLEVFISNCTRLETLHIQAAYTC